MKIDVFCHVMPPDYLGYLRKKISVPYYVDAIRGLWDLDARFRVMDRFEHYQQVLTLSSPSLESVAKPEDAIDLARAGNDALAELVVRHPDRFPAAVAALPMNDVEAAVAEAERAIGQLGFRGVEIYTPVGDRPLDLPEFEPLWEKMSSLNLPIWVHPHREENVSDYGSEPYSRFNIMITLGWPYETSVFMARMAYSGIFEKYPDLKFITHHAGAMIPALGKRFTWFTNPQFWPEHSRSTYPLTCHPVDHLRRFYCDTAISGSTPGLACAHAFFGTDHLLFGTDTPFDMDLGYRSIRETIRSVEELGVSEAQRSQIFEGNLRRLLHLPI